MSIVLDVCCLVNLILGALSSEFHSTSSTSESPQKKEQWVKSEQKTKIMETVELEGEKEIEKLVLTKTEFFLTISIQYLADKS